MAYTAMVESHIKSLIAHGQDTYGPVTTPMWMASLDTRTKLPPDSSHVPRRVYRLIGAPGGTTLYWDQPMLVSAYILSQITGKSEYAEAADAYVRSFLERCVDAKGMFQWGNHQYYNALDDKVVNFSGGYHELRPITPAWSVFWRHDADACERYLRTMTERHLWDAQAGGFNRHDDGKRGHAFIEAGGILVETVAWLYQKTQDPELLEKSLNIARFSYEQRGKETGLLINSPDSGRWDGLVATTEVGLWSQCLLNAARYSSNEEFVKMARNAVLAYLKYGWDEEAEQFYGQLSIADGSSVSPTEKGYWPGKYSDIWNIDQWPTHDYPMALAEACITLYKYTGEPEFLEGILRWARVIQNNPPDHNSQGIYAECYGRCIHFLVRAARELQKPELRLQAQYLAQKAADALYEDGMFRGYRGGHIYESVDGVGFLCLALLYLESQSDLDFLGFRF